MRLVRGLLVWLGLAEPERSGVFTATIGSRKFHLDPSEVRRKLNLACPEWDQHVALIQAFAIPLTGPLADPLVAQGRSAAAEAAMLELTAAVSVAFVAPPLAPDGTGFSEAERIGLLTQYLGYCKTVLDASRPLANSPAGTVSPAGAG